MEFSCYPPTNPLPTGRESEPTMHDYDTYLTRKRIEHGEKFNADDLDPRFIPFFNNGRRVKVKTCGQIVTGTIGVTTGWKPCFLLMRTPRSRGSEWTLGPADTILGFK